MGNESIEASFLSIFALINFFIFLIISKFSHIFKNGLLIDQDFSKPQAFHKLPVTRSGGIACILSMSVFYYFFYLLYSKILYDYIFLSWAMFLVGFLDDLKINIKPLVRLFLMICLITFITNYLPIKILNIDIPFLNFLLKNKIFSSFFILLCFLFIINGSNLIDGFHGLLTLNLLIINLILVFVNINNENIEFSIILISQVIVLLSFLLFNFPKAKIFMGDGGAYVMGSLIALNTIITNNLNPNISSFFFCTILFYLFFEVFFSFLRKVIQKKSPIHPDSAHLHMLLYKYLNNFKKIENANPKTSLIINFIFIILIIPPTILNSNSTFCVYWFIFQIIFYVIIYSRLSNFLKELDKDLALKE